MTAGELARRIMVWALVAVYLVASIVGLAATGAVWPLAAWSGYAIVGAVLLTVRAGSWIGAMMLAVALYWGISGLLYIQGVVDAVPTWVELVILAFGPLIWTLVPLLLTVFPDDRVTSRFGKVNVALIAAVGVVFLTAQLISTEPLELSGRANPLAITALGPVTTALLSEVTFLVVPALIASALVDLALRWRRSVGARRLQFRWIAYGGAVTMVLLVLANVFPVLPEPLVLIAILSFNAIPITVLIALTRHGLYEINRVVSRTVTYVIVTALAIGVYALVVTSVTWVAPSAPSLAVAAATLAAAALCLPLLRRVQHVVDRRFDRERYDAQSVVDAFGERLRSQLDPSATTTYLVEATDRTLRPTSVGVWTKGASR